MKRYGIAVLFIFMMLFLTSNSLLCRNSTFKTISTNTSIDFLAPDTNVSLTPFDSNSQEKSSSIYSPTPRQSAFPIGSLEKPADLKQEDIQNPMYSKQEAEQIYPNHNNSAVNTIEKIAEIPNWYESKDTGYKVPILMYHNLTEGDNNGDGLNVSEKVFENQMYTLKAHGYNTISFEELYNHYNNADSLPDNPIIITFDDGYKSNFTIGYPILEKYGFKACVFIITNAIGASNYMNRNELSETSASGVFEVQCHTVSHDYYIYSSDIDNIRREIADSKNILESITGKRVNIFCYPYGKYSQNFIDELVSELYIFAVTTKHGCAKKTHHPMLLPRIRVSGTETGETLKKKIEDLTNRKTKYIGVSDNYETPIEHDEEESPVPSPDTDVSPPPPEQEVIPTPSPDTNPAQPTPESEPIPVPLPNTDISSESTPEPGATTLPCPPTTTPSIYQ